MIVPVRHHNQRGTHEKADLIDWLCAQSWAPLSRSAFEDGASVGAILPAPNETWVREDDRFVDGSQRARYVSDETLKRAGWVKRDLFCLAEATKHVGQIAGFRCRNCAHVFALQGLRSFPCGYLTAPEHAVCLGCDEVTRRVITSSPQKIMKETNAMHYRIKAARRAVANLAEMKRLPKWARDDLAAIAEVVGHEERAA